MKYHGQFDPPVDRVLHERYFGNSLVRGTCLECGAFDGVLESSCLFFAESLGWRAINVEASPPIFERLAANRPDALNVHAALSDADGTVSFTHAYHPELQENFGNGSVAHTGPHRAELDALGCTYRTWDVPKIAYRTLVERHRAQSIDLMVLDVEGHEAAAIRGMFGCSVLPTVLCVEVGHSGTGEIAGLLDALGYSLDATSFVNAFFVKKDKRKALANFGK